MTDQSKPSPGAVRAAEKIINIVAFGGRPPNIPEAIKIVTTIIDQETAAPELLEALEKIANASTSLHDRARIARAAIAKATGGTE